MTTFDAHIFRRRKRGEREEVRLKLFNSDGTPAELGGGGGLIHKVIEIPHAQILTLFSIGATLLEPTEILDYEGLPTEIPVPVSCYIIGISEGGAAYANTAGRYFKMTLSTGNDASLGTTVQQSYIQNVATDVDNDGVVEDSFTMPIMQEFMKLPEEGHSYFSGMFVFAETGSSRLDGNLQDNGLLLTLGSIEGGSSGNVTGGDPSNKLLVHLTYFIAKLT